MYQFSSKKMVRICPSVPSYGANSTWRNRHVLRLYSKGETKTIRDARGRKRTSPTANELADTATRDWHVYGNFLTVSTWEIFTSAEKTMNWLKYDADAVRSQRRKISMHLGVSSRVYVEELHVYRTLIVLCNLKQCRERLAMRRNYTTRQRAHNELEIFLFQPFVLTARKPYRPHRVRFIW